MPASTETHNLYVKSFFASSMQEAIQQAHEQLGPDALLLNTREAPPEARHLGAFEVIFGGSTEPAAGLPRATDAPSGMDEIRQRMDQIQKLLSRVMPLAGWQGPRVSAVEQTLIAAEVEPELAHDIAETVRVRLGKPSVLPISGARHNAGFDPATVAAEVSAEIAGRFEVNSELARITAFVGPPGCGKTTTLVKLAVSYGVALGRPVRLISADTYRIGGAEQLRAYAMILGAGFEAVDTPAGLAHAIQSAAPEELVLIDTPGWSSALLKEVGGELAAFLAGRQEIDTHLVLTASMRSPELRLLADEYAVFQPSKLLFTRLDEATCRGAVFCEAVRQGKPISFLTHGQDIPEDLEKAAKEQIVEFLVRQLPLALQAVA